MGFAGATMNAPRSSMQRAAACVGRAVRWARHLCLDSLPGLNLCFPSWSGRRMYPCLLRL